MISIKTNDGRKTIDGHTYKVFVKEALNYVEEGISDDWMKTLLKSEFKVGKSRLLE